MAKQENNLTAAAPFLRDIVFGVHDALLTNIGIVIGFVAALESNRLIVMAALIDVIISALAMSFGTYLSRTSESAYLEGHLEEEAHKDLSDALGNPIMAAVVMWVTYFISGMIPLLPFMVGLEPTVAVRYAVGLALLVFFGVGVLKGYLTNTGRLKGGLQFLAFGSVAAIIGYYVGTYGQQFIR